MVTYWMIRHKPTGKTMPLIESGYGYTHWEPTEPSQKYFDNFSGVPRLFVSLASARASASAWVQGKWRTVIETEMGEYGSRLYTYTSVPFVYEECHDRKYEDLEFVEIQIDSSV